MWVFCLNSVIRDFCCRGYFCRRLLSLSWIHSKHTTSFVFTSSPPQTLIRTKLKSESAMYTRVKLMKNKKVYEKPPQISPCSMTDMFQFENKTVHALKPK